jgi:filamentous hemagglutinin family protein
MRGVHQRAASFILGLIFCTSGILVVSDQNVLAQVTTAITPSGLNTHVSAPTLLPSGQITHDITGGTRPGNGTNLFHSFGDFSVGANNIANFLNETGLPTANILGRVTGGNISNIFGTIQTTNFGNANLFLMNPAGFLFGPTATVNVGGMMTFTSADYLRLADGARFKAVPNAAADALLSAAPVAAFGFLGSNPGAITVQGSQLSVAPGTGISLVGGNITIQSGTLPDGTVQPARLSAPEGQINLVSVNKPSNKQVGGEVILSGADLSSGLVPTGFRSLGAIALTQGSSVDTSTATTSLGGPAGGVSIRGGQFVMDASSITALSNNAPMGKGGNIEVMANTVSLSNQSSIRTGSTGWGGECCTIPGNITVNAGTFSATNSEISIGAFAGQNPTIPPGTITIQGLDGADSSARLVTLTNSTLENNIAAQQTVNFGGAPITIQAKDVKLNQSVLNTFSVDSPGGPISIVADRQIQSIGSRLFSGGNFNIGGTIDLRAGAGINLTNTEIRSGFGEPSASGNISLSAPVITLHGGMINADGGFPILGPFFPPATIRIEATQGVRIIDGARISADSLNADIHGPATNGGNIVINAGAKFVIENSTISAQSPRGNGGTIHVQADQVRISDSQLTTSVGGGPLTVGGRVTLDSNDVRLNNSQILSTATEGQGGTIDITSHAFRSVGSVVDASSQFGTNGTVTIH